MNPAEVSIIKCESYEPVLVQEKLRQAVDLIGGIANFIKPRSRVLVKPNLLMAKEPESGITTHPEVVRAAVSLLKEIDCKIFLGDGPSVWGNQIENVDEVYERTGMRSLCQQEGIELVKFDKRRMRKNFPLTTWLDECDHLVSIPKFKTHEFTLLTAAIKNLFGLVSGTYKTELHKNYFEKADFAKILVDIYQETRPSLTIVDGILAMEGDGPGTGGRSRKVDLLLASRDCVALDSVLAWLMGIKPLDVLSTREAASRGLGASSMDAIAIKGENLANVRPKPFLLPSSSPQRELLPRPLAKIFKKMVKYTPYVQRQICIRCAACIESCPQKVISMQNEGIVFDYRKCIACFCCQEVCPEAAIKIKKSLLAKIIGL